MTNKKLFHQLARVGSGIGCALAIAMSNNLQGATTDLATGPLVTTSSGTVLPNIFYMMDDSGSMDWTFMPDNASNFLGAYGYYSGQCNGVYYDPTISYIPPVTANGTSYANSSFTAAWTNGYNTGLGTVNLSTSFNGDPYGFDAAQAGYYYVYSGAQTTQRLKDYFNTGSTFYSECSSPIGSAPGSSVFTLKVVSAISGPGATDERTNFANWYSYYRKRIYMMKTASGIAFKPIDNRYRVGFATINNNTGISMLNVANFDATQKAAWYAKLYGTTVGSSTPLREALSNVGRYYANKLTTLNGVATTDPVQYSCQQNFTILSTDGYWNSGGTFNLSGGLVGNQDGSAARPYYDGAVGATAVVTTTTKTTTPTTTTTTTPSTAVQRSRTASTATTTTPWSRTNTTVSGTQTCNTVTAPSGSCITDSGSRIWCTYTSNSVSNTGRCFNTGNGVYACRTFTGSTQASTSGSGCLTDSKGARWCVYANNSTAGTSSCTSLATGAYVCKAPNDGFTVTAQPQSYSQVGVVTTTNGTDTTVTTTTTTTATNNAISTRVVVTTNGVVTSDTTTPSSSTGAPTTTSSSSSGSPATIATTTGTTDTGAPTGSTTWTNNGAATTSCSATPPAPSATAPAAGAPVNSNGSSTTTTTGPSTAGASTTTSSTGAPVVTTTTSTVNNPGTGGTTDTLADVAQYYYTTDLRTTALGNNIGALGTDVSQNNVPASGLDAASYQHLTTFTLGLGTRGRMVFSPTYLADSSGDFFAVKNGSVANSATGVCSWQADGTVCNWPTPGPDLPENVDDLWHAAVNGRGNYFAATNPAVLATAISDALAGVSARTGASAAATTSNPNVTSGDNFVFSSTFTTNQWDGELVRQQLSLTTGVVSTSIDWKAQGQLDTKVLGAYSATARNIYTRDSIASSGLKSFEWANLSATEKLYFTTPSVALSQFCTVGATCLSTANQTLASGDNLVRFLRGDRTNEGISTDTSKYYHARTHVLGDIVNAEAVYVKGSLFNYGDTGYSAFITQNATRKGYVYVAANDGMLHAFDAGDGSEAWAYVPSFVLPNMYKLADKNYANLHQYLLDGTPISADVYFGSAWHTILVGGQNGGGRGYYAMDITGDAITGIVTPKVLWEFTDTNLGFTYGNPVITKLKDGTWVVLVTSGYNNVTPGDGVGRLYVLNAGTGALIRSISTGVGSTTTPSGLARINAWVDNATADNTALRAYGGDLLGNVWRFDINGDIGAPGYDAQNLIALVDNIGTAQPITSKPELGAVSGKAIIYVGTGQYLGSSDLATTQQQSFYAIKDDLGSTTLGNPRTAATNFVQQTLTSTTCPTTAPATVCTVGQIVRTSSSRTVNFSTNNGWFIDFLDSGERANTDPQLALGTLVFNTNVPNASACTIGGYSIRYFLDYRTGAAISTAGGVVAVALGNALATRPVLVRLPNNTIVSLTRLSDGTTVTSQVPIGGNPGGTRRITWRELVN